MNEKEEIQSEKERNAIYTLSGIGVAFLVVGLVIVLAYLVLAIGFQFNTKKSLGETNYIIDGSNYTIGIVKDSDTDKLYLKVVDKDNAKYISCDYLIENIDDLTEENKNELSSEKDEISYDLFTKLTIQ